VSTNGELRQGRIWTLSSERRLQAAATWQILRLPRKRGVPMTPHAQLRGQFQEAPKVGDLHHTLVTLVNQDKEKRPGQCRAGALSGGGTKC